MSEEFDKIVHKLEELRKYIVSYCYNLHEEEVDRVFERLESWLSSIKQEVEKRLSMNQR